MIEHTLIDVKSSPSEVEVAATTGRGSCDANAAALDGNVTAYSEFAAYLQNQCGILLGDNKEHLVLSRLGKIMARYEIADLHELLRRIEQNAATGLQEQVLDALTTTDSLWFRDKYPFEFFKSTILPTFNQGAGSLTRVWSAACSYGQEPYSISIAAEEYNQEHAADAATVEVIATDLSPATLDYCRNAEYDSATMLAGLSSARISACFDQTESGWMVAPKIRDRVYLQKHNLLESFSALGIFDVIFCRNVLLYFSEQDKLDILQRMLQALRPGGYLFLGNTESMPHTLSGFESVDCEPGIVYRAS